MNSTGSLCWHTAERGQNGSRDQLRCNQLPRRWRGIVARRSAAIKPVTKANWYITTRSEKTRRQCRS
ncbi:hypothetical protein FOXYSP1_05519 [Fusarium oxysporum f. sp. phaseoli]